MMSAAPLDPGRFAGEIRGQPVGLYTLAAADGLRACICNHGARLLQLLVPDAHGGLRDVVLGYDSLPQMSQGLASMGAVIGRYANRIGNSRFAYEGGHWNLQPNEGRHCLHGGPGGSRYQGFKVIHHAADRIDLGWRFLEAEDGFPGDVDLTVSYCLNGQGTLVMETTARPLNKATPLSFTNHAFFNLDGSGDVADHRVQSDARWFLEVDAQKIPTGQLLPVAGTPLDFQQEKVVRQTWPASPTDPGQPLTQDHCLVFAQSTQARLQRMVRVCGPRSGIRMEVWSDAPAAQWYIGGGPNASMSEHCGKHGQRYHRLSAFCIEPQAYPDAPNHPHFPTTLVRPGEVHHGRIEYRFSR